MSRQVWTAAENEYLRSRYATTSTDDLVQALGRSARSIYQRARVLGLNKSAETITAAIKAAAARGTPNTGRFQTGIVPWNTGKKGYDPGGRSHETRFKKGNMSGAAQAKYVPIGSLRLSKDGYLERKVNDDHPTPARRWVAVHRLVWEAAHGAIPPGHIVIFKPGARTNVEEQITLDKLECITRIENMRRNTLHRYPKEIALAIQMRGALNRRINREQRQQDHRRSA